MILSVNGTLSIFAAYANILTIATFLGIGVETTRRYAAHPVVKMILLYVFAYSVISDKLACLLAVALFTVVEVREFISDAADIAVDKLEAVEVRGEEPVLLDAVADAAADAAADPTANAEPELDNNFE